jgi:hypothetical protein
MNVSSISIKKYKYLIKKKVDVDVIEKKLWLEQLKIVILKRTKEYNFLEYEISAKSKDINTMYPSKISIKNIKLRIKSILKESKYNIKYRLHKTSVLYHNWIAYHKHSNTRKVNLWSIKNWIYKFTKAYTTQSKDVLLEVINEIFCRY